MMNIDADFVRAMSHRNILTGDKRYHFLQAGREPVDDEDYVRIVHKQHKRKKQGVLSAWCAKS